MNNIKITPTDITTLNVDAIVNAANNSLLGGGGGGVDGYPIADACHIAITEVLNYAPHYQLEQIIFASFSDEVTKQLNEALVTILNNSN